MTWRILVYSHNIPKQEPKCLRHAYICIFMSRCSNAFFCSVKFLRARIHTCSAMKSIFYRSFTTSKLNLYVHLLESYVFMSQARRREMGDNYNVLGKCCVIYSRKPLRPWKQQMVGVKAISHERMHSSRISYYHMKSICCYCKREPKVNHFCRVYRVPRGHATSRKVLAPPGELLVIDYGNQPYRVSTSLGNKPENSVFSLAPS